MVRIRFDSIKIDTISGSSSVNKGLNVIIGRRSSEQRNEAMGSVAGSDNRVESGQSVGRTGSKRP
ncbi:hypothetical protein [Paenibacillus ginsengarvi]|uniref:Uncharacterized protein n=1 Tax=Paenibacillus ginsengarvi TaxID=400777 RepID=A0A3B0CTB1_9BACL|nr:hypothetical protein [Paenibacillus ginsengarvi]RKN86397.1 hypothetical protein D7M11_00035 [Paenibacillus ginsengarvi]